MGSLFAPRAAIVGAGISGIVTAAHLKKNGIHGTVFERASEIGGVWVYNENPPPEPFFPAVKASEGELSPEGDSFAPAGPCYRDLQNNVPTPLMATSLSEWPEGTPDIVPHHVIKTYIQSVAAKSGVTDWVKLNTAVLHAEKVGAQWRVDSSSRREDGQRVVHSELFDTLIVASGHYHAAKIPDIPGLSKAKSHWPSKIIHSKTYRTPETFKGQRVLLIGAGTSSTDIAKEIGPHADKIYQSARNGLFDFPAEVLPQNAVRVGEIEKFEILPQHDSPQASLDSGAIPLAVHLKSGEIIENLHSIIVSTGYHFTLPFLRQYHDDSAAVQDATDTILVTDGTQLHNLHKDIFYIPDPSLIFVGVPFFTATFNLFDFQAMAVAAVVSGKATLPSEAEMRDEYERKIKSKGYGKPFHSLKDGQVEYTNELLAWINSQLSQRRQPLLQAHTPAWLEKYKQLTESLQSFGRGNNSVQLPKGAPEPILSN